MHFLVTDDMIIEDGVNTYWIYIKLVYQLKRYHLTWYNLIYWLTCCTSIPQTRINILDSVIKEEQACFRSRSLSSDHIIWYLRSKSNLEYSGELWHHYKPFCFLPYSGSCAKPIEKPYLNHILELNRDAFYGRLLAKAKC